MMKKKVLTRQTEVQKALQRVAVKMDNVLIKK
jgi:hypothetical protein